MAETPARAIAANAKSSTGGFGSPVSLIEHLGVIKIEEVELNLLGFIKTWTSSVFVSVTIPAYKILVSLAIYYSVDSP
jgi:hypothetical protein